MPLLNNSKIEVQTTDASVISEVFGVYPIGLKEVATIEGTKIYTSNKLRKQFLEAIKNQKLTKVVYPTLESLTNQAKIIPCYSKSGLISFLVYKLFGSKVDKSLCAFYYPDTNKVYMLFDNNVEYLAWANDEWLSIVLFHELQHYAAKNLRMKFFNLHKSFLLSFYQYHYEYYFEIKKLKKSYVAPILKQIIKGELSHAEADIFKVLVANEKAMMKYIGPHTEHITKKTQQYSRIVYLYLVNRDRYMKLLAQRDKEVMKFHFSFDNAYEKLGYPKLSSFFGQEAYAPSEIICMTAERKPTSGHYAVIKQLK